MRRDGFLTEDELKSVFHYLHPTEHDYARIQVGLTCRMSRLKGEPPTNQPPHGAGFDKASGAS